MKKRFITTKELAEQLGIKMPTVYAWVSQRKIRYVKVGRLVKFRPEDVDELLNRNTVEERQEM